MASKIAGGLTLNFTLIESDTVKWLSSTHMSSHKITVGLVQFNKTFMGYTFLPSGPGMLQAYCLQKAKNADRYQFLEPLFSAIPNELAALQLASADVIGFGVYLWNFQRSLRLAQRLKQENPHRLIIFGGPHVPDQAEAFLRANPDVDVCCHGQGELTFTALLENFLLERWPVIPGISYINGKGEFIHHPQAPRVKELEDLPSPFLTGVLDSLLAAYPRVKWGLMWETNRGCPFSCTFCDWGAAVQSKVRTFNQERLFKEIDWMSEKKIELLYCCDANFGILPRDVEIIEYMAEKKFRTGYPVTMTTSTTKNVSERTYHIFKRMVDTGLLPELTFSFQSLDPQTLKYVKRDNISLKIFSDLQQRFRREGIFTYTDILLGLPGETYDSFVRGVDTLISNGQHHQIRFYDVIILPNSELSESEYRVKYGIQSILAPLPINQQDIDDDIQEKTEIVIATDSMSTTDWGKMKLFAYITKFFHFGLMPLQLVFVVMHVLSQVSYAALLQAFCEPEPTKYPLLYSISNAFKQHIQHLLQGGSELIGVDLPGHKTHYYYPETLMLIHLCSMPANIDALYQESKCLIQANIPPNVMLPPDLLDEALLLNQQLFLLGIEEDYAPLTQLHADYQRSNVKFQISYNIYALYQAELRGEICCLEQTPIEYSRTWYGYPFYLKTNPQDSHGFAHMKRTKWG